MAVSSLRFLFFILYIEYTTNMSSLLLRFKKDSISTILNFLELLVLEMGGWKVGYIHIYLYIYIYI